MMGVGIVQVDDLQQTVQEREGILAQKIYSNKQKQYFTCPLCHVFFSYDLILNPKNTDTILNV
jgi:hypothetical protein